MAFIDRQELPYEEKMVWASVLRRAVFDFVLYKGIRAHSLDWKRAFQFIFVENLECEGLSFEDVCDLFGWEPGYLRRMVSKLTRDDIKKMETTQFREDFVFDIVKVTVENAEKWRTSNHAAPFLPLYKYTKEYRDKIALKTVRKESYLQTVPVIQWQARVNG